jgi:hypothetical protein
VRAVSVSAVITRCFRDLAAISLCFDRNLHIFSTFLGVKVLEQGRLI